MATCGVYVIGNNITGKAYIGSSANIEKRITRAHFPMLRHNRHPNSYLQAAWNKHGEHSFFWFILEETTEALLLEREQAYLDLYKPFKHTGFGYNLALFAGAPAKGIKASDATKAKLSASHKLNEAHKEHCRALALSQAKTCTLISPSGKVVTVTNLSKFARDNGLTNSSVSRLCNGILSQTKGWRLAQAT